MVYRTTPTYETLTNLYDVIRRTFKDGVYYSEEEVRELKDSGENIFLKKGD